MGPSFEEFNWDKTKQSQLPALAIRCTKELYLECQASPQYAYPLCEVNSMFGLNRKALERHSLAVLCCIMNFYCE